MKNKNDGALPVQAFHVTEGVGGTLMYHLSPEGTNSRSVCGAKTMHTSLPLSSWGVRSAHLNERYCQRCAAEATDALLAAGVDLSFG